MNLRDQINSALGAHRLWRHRLEKAISAGSSEFTVELLQSDRLCAFGRWLFGPTIPASMKEAPQLRRTVELHHHFHQEAAKVLALALGGDKAAATAAMGPGSGYDLASRALTEAMQAWAASLE